MPPVRRAFYDWYDANGVASVSVEQQRALFEAGWEAATEFIGSAIDEEPAS